MSWNILTTPSFVGENQSNSRRIVFIMITRNPRLAGPSLDDIESWRMREKIMEVTSDQQIKWQGYVEEKRKKMRE